MKLLASSLLFSYLLVAQVTVTIPGNRVITLAGQPAGTRSTNNSRSAPADSPIPVNIALVAGQALQFTATGSVDGNGPDGRPTCNTGHSAEFSIARINGLCRTLIGVFLADTTRPQPAAGIDYTGDARNVPVQYPLLQQPFAIGSGITPTGERKAIVVPAGATRLFLAPIGLPTSTGDFTVTVTATGVPEIPTNPIRVSGTGVIQLAGQTAGTLSANNARIAPMHSPALVSVPLVAGQVLRISASGSVEGDGPEGRTSCNDRFLAEFSVARIESRCRALIGVFMADSLRAQPPNLVYTGATRDTVRVEPLIQQPFLVGSGFTDSGQRKEFVVPSGATRLYLAPMANATSDGAFTVTVTPETAVTPLTQRSGLVSAAGYGGSAPAAGGLISLFGQQLADQTEAASTVPLPLRLRQTRVYVNLRPAPLFFVSPGQINAQVPWEFAGDTTAQVVVVRDGRASLPIPVDLAPASPGIFLVGPEEGVVVNASSGQLVGTSQPARPGDALVIYASGLGAVNGAVMTGAPASSTTLEPTQRPVEAILTLNGQASALPVLFAGSAPGFIGVNQVNVQIPANLPAGAGSLKLRTQGSESNAVNIAVRQ